MTKNFVIILVAIAVGAYFVYRDTQSPVPNFSAPGVAGTIMIGLGLGALVGLRFK